MIGQITIDSESIEGALNDNKLPADAHRVEQLTAVVRSMLEQNVEKYTAFDIELMTVRDVPHSMIAVVDNFNCQLGYKHV